MKKNIFALSLFILGWTAPLSAEIMTYQGRLKESNVPVNASRSFLFEFCATETPTGCVASADGAKPFAVQNGLFKSTFTLPAVDLSAGPWYLRVQVEGSYLSPVERLTFVPYSLYASTAGYSPAALQKAGDTMSGQLTLANSTLTVTGNAFSVGGSTLVASGGRVGIGTSAPQYPLVVYGYAGDNIINVGDPVNVGANTAGFGLDGFGTYAGAALYVNNAKVFNVESNGGAILGSTYMTADAVRNGLIVQGNVGIGTSVPNYALEISSGAGEAGTIMSVSTGATNLFWVAGDGAHSLKFTGDGSGLTGVTGAVGIDAARVLKAGDTMSGSLTLANGSTLTVSGSDFSVGGSTLAAVNGKVGIGTALPDTALHISYPDANGPGFKISNSAAAVEMGLWGGIGDQFYISRGGNNFIIDGSGRVGMGGVYSPGAALDVKNLSSGGSAIALRVSSGTATAHSPLFQVQQDGNVGIGTSAPGTTLDVAGSGNFTGSVTSLSSGTFRAVGNNQFSVETSSGILVQAGRIQAPAIQLTKGAVANYVLTSDAAGNAGWVNPVSGALGDGWVGNEITDVGDTTLSRSGTGTMVDPYKIALNLSNSNTWVSAQTFNSGLTGSLSGAASQNVLKAGDTMTGQLTLAGSTLTVTGDAFSVGGSTLVVTNGYLGLGTNAPTARLHVVSDNGYVHFASPNSQLIMNMIPQTYAPVILNNNGDGPLAFSIGNAEQMRIGRQTLVGIGTQTPAYRLHVSSGAGESGTILAVSTGTSVIFGVKGNGEVLAGKYYGDGSGLTGVSGTDNTKLPLAGGILTGQLTSLSSVTITGNGGVYGLRVSSNVSLAGALYSANGNVGIGTISPGAMLDVAGPGNFSGSVTSYSSGTFRAAGGNQFSVETSSGILVQAGRIQAPAIQLTNGAAANYVLTSDAAGNAGWVNPVSGALGDGWVGNEITDAGNTTLTRSGTGTMADPYKLVLNLSNANAWTGVQTFSGGLAGTLTGNAATVTNGVYTTGSYADPAWVASLGTGKINLSTVTARLDAASVFIATATSRLDAHLAFISTATTKLDGADSRSLAAEAFISTAATAIDGKMLRSGDVMTGQLTNTSSVTITGNGGGAYGLQVSSNVSLAGVLYSANGNVGIGMANPSADFHVRGAAGASFVLDSSVANGNPNLLVKANAGAGNAGISIDRADTGGIANFTLLTNGVYQWLFKMPDFTAGDATRMDIISSNAASRMTFLQSGSVGVGTTTPTGLFQVGGGSLTVLANGNVGVGTVSPAARLDVRDNSPVNSTEVLTVGNKEGQSLNIGATPSIGIRSYNQPLVTIAGYVENAATPPPSSFIVQTNTGVGLTEKLRITSTGDVGISIGAPQARLDVLAGGSAQTNMAQIWRNSGGTIVSSVSATGVLMASKFVGDGSGLNGVSATDATKLPLGGGTLTGQLTNTSSVTITGNGGGAYGLQVSSNISLAGALYSANGNVGIAAPSPTGLFQVGGGSLTVLAGGNVGIGTTAPARKLEVNGEITASHYEIGGSTVVAVLPASSLGVGINAGQLSTGGNNSFVGYSAGSNNTTGSGNTFMGNGAGVNNIGGSYNSIFGWEPSAYNKSGSENVILGARAGYGVLNNSFSSSTIVGTYAGFGLTTGNDNIFVGHMAGFSVTTGTGNIVIGYGKNTTAPGASNELNIGGVIYGNLAAGYIGVGAGVTNPGGALQVGQNGLIISTGGAIQTTGLGHGSATGGPRGVGAVDLQTFRTAVGQVASGAYSVVGGGYGNSATASYAFAGGGYTNLASGGYSVAGGGQSNLSSNGWTTVAGGSNNVASQNNATVGGGSGNTAAGYSATVAGGSGNNVQSTAFAGFIGGGGNNISTGAYSTVGGGSTNTSSGAYSAVLGGQGNLADGAYAAVGGGRGNNAAWGFSAVAGGENNRAWREWAIVAGGTGNTADGQASGIIGGDSNKASGFGAFIGGGAYNQAKGWGAVAFGASNASMADYTFAAGKAATSAVNGTFTWADSTSEGAVNSVLNQVMFKTKGGFWVSTGTVYSDPGLYVDANNRVGVGTAFPTAKLQLGGTPGVDGIRFPDGTLQTTAGVGVANNVSNTFDAIINGDSDGNLSGSVRLQTAGLDRVYVSTGGQVGIGTISPSVRFHNAGSAILADITTIDPDSYGNAVIAGGFSDVGWNAYAIGGKATNAGTTWGIGHNNADLLFAAGDATNPNTLQTFMQATWKRNLALVPVSGNVGIGTSVIPDQKLTVIGSISQTGVLLSSGTGNNYFAGNVGIGTNTPVAMLDVNGTARLGRYVVESRDFGGTMTAADFGKTITVNSASQQGISLPVGTAGSIGAQFTFVKLGTGRMTIVAGGSDFIADSSPAGMIYNDAVSPAYATLTLRLVTSNQWMLVGGEGAWVTQ